MSGKNYQLFWNLYLTQREKNDGLDKITTLEEHVVGDTIRKTKLASSWEPTPYFYTNDAVFSVRN